MEGNGQNERESRLDRLEDAYNLMIQDHEEFRREHKMLLAAQVVMHDEQLKTEKSVRRLSGKLEDLTEKVEEIGDKLNALITWSEQTQRENEVRFRRLEEKH